VTGLTLDAVQTIDRGVLIQGFKTRTGDHTPIAHIAPSDAAAIWAIRFLVRRLDALQKYGFVPPGSKSLWLGSRYSKDGPRLFIASNALHSFQKRHRLPQFSFDQIRPEVIAASVVNGEIENGRRIAGHVGISTTGHYLDQLLLNRLNSAINLEFQKRLERSVRWNIREESSQEVSPALLDLAPIGDGASCRDPQHPPVAAWFDNTGCKAQDCHRGNGCPNREILIDADRIREIALTTRYYRKSWKELAEENWERFEKQHLPALIFNTTLKSIVRRGPYGFLFRTIEGEINALDR
jgi:hypothetical protein